MNVTAQDEIFNYVEGVRQALGGLPAATREELLEDLPEHLAEVLAEGGGTLVGRLGSPSTYAAELIASAGLADAAADERPARGARLGQLRAQARDAMRRADVRFGPLLGYAKASEFLVLLRPAWWVLRGYLVAMAFAYVVDDNGGPIGLLPRIGNNELVALLLLAAAVLGSIWLGRRGEPAQRMPRLLLRGGGVALAIFAFAGFLETDGQARDGAYLEMSYVSEYSDVRDVFVYDSRGNLVQGAQLYDQYGNPMRFGDPGCYEEGTGNWVASRQLGYPYCPEQAPFRSSAGNSDPRRAEPSEGPAEPAAPSPSGLP
ncbi:hypothetical protein [Actinoplanes sp. DH11]|uniref:HAAS signaling domain-containing protein n=1 Tax=Actinoplanes sp. DH11 TaxID=2857011 RepID=UPI001E335EA9|nr:hypothetical protein [Actinoplanes sp. DH11]